ncbi:MAG: C69 family dipeptidase [Bacteroidales bacterium]|nr:C69 family dipeptidase [Bacteroidales bacterium]
MKTFYFKLFICGLAFVMVAGVGSLSACTTMIITKGASATGSMMVSHSDDDELGDQRIIHVPSRLQSGSRDIYTELYRYPRINTHDRGEFYYTEGYPLTPVLYHLPYEEIWKLLGRKTEKSYAYFDASYGIMNEMNLMIGECTNGANFEPEANAVKAPGNPMRIFYTQELSHLALENCSNAREAIRFMGALMENYGYFSTGETLLVADENEAWVFEMCALPDDVYHSAWVAKRVKDGEYFVAANEFRIRFLEKDNPEGFMYSSMLIPGLKKIGWWDETKDGPIDWLKAVSPGEYNHPYYSLRRVWRAMDRVNPDLGLSPWVENGYTFDYPFSIKPKNKLTAQDVFSLYRDHYEGTEFDMTKGIAAGPYGDPHRFVGPYDGNQNDVSKGKTMAGAWERAISVFYQGYTYVCEVDPKKPEPVKGLVWFGPDVSYSTVFTPFYAKMSTLPTSFQTSGPQQFNNKAAWWAFNFVNNWSRLNFQLIIHADVIPTQQILESNSLEMITQMEVQVKDLSEQDAIKLITKSCIDNGNGIVERWWTLAADIVAKYSDGYINLPDGSYSSPEINLTRTVGYPAGWLNSTDYHQGPVSYDMK